MSTAARSAAAVSNVIATTGEGLVRLSVSSPERLVIAQRVWSTSVETAGGRVAYITSGRETTAKTLVPTDLEGKVLKRLERFGEHRWPVGELALTDRRVAWSVRRGG